MILAIADLVDARMKIDYYEQALVIARETGYRRGEGIQPIWAWCTRGSTDSIATDITGSRR